LESGGRRLRAETAVRTLFDIPVGSIWTVNEVYGSRVYFIDSHNRAVDSARNIVVTVLRVDDDTVDCLFGDGEVGRLPIVYWTKRTMSGPDDWGVERVA
jgi:hypothetical protein